MADVRFFFSVEKRYGPPDRIAESDGSQNRISWIVCSAGFFRRGGEFIEIAKGLEFFKDVTPDELCAEKKFAVIWGTQTLPTRLC
jgi:hypothetical protein